MKLLKDIVLLMLPLFLMYGCKQDEWMDWKLENELWLRQNGQSDAVRTTPTGLQYRVLYQGNEYDAKPSNGSVVVMDYSLRLINGIEVDNSKGVSMTVTKYDGTTGSGLIDGFVEGLKRMNVGGDYVLYVPWELGYGKDGGAATEQSSSFIPPYSTLIFTIHLSSVNR